jgi:hypothetical protein
MNYIEIFRESVRIFRTTKPIWIFGALSLLITLPLDLSSSVRNNPVLPFVYLPILLAGLLITCIATGGLYYAIHQASLNKHVSFSDGWQHGKSKALQCAGLIVISIPFLLIGAVFARIIPVELHSSPLPWLLALLGNALLVPFLSFGFSAILIDDVKVLAAAWTSFRILIYGNNFFHVLVIVGSMFILRFVVTGLIVAILITGLFGVVLPTPLTLDYPTYQKVLATPLVAGWNWVFNLILFPLQTIMLVFVYLKFTNEVAYPALAQRQNTAQQGVQQLS